MDREVSIQKGVEKLIDKRLSLSEILGTDWKEKVIFPSVESVLKKEGITSLTDGEEVSPTGIKTTVDKFILEINDVFTQNGSEFHAKSIINEQGEQKALIVGKIGKDTLYQTADLALFTDTNEGNKKVTWIVDEIGLVSENGQVFNINELIKLQSVENKNKSLFFTEIVKTKFEENLNYFNSRKGNITWVSMPNNYKEIGILFHELGHMLRVRFKLDDKEMISAYMTANKELRETKDSPYNSETKLSTYQIRKIMADEERGAWALGMSLLKDVGISIGLDCATPEALKSITLRLEDALKSYDRLHYHLKHHNEKEIIPAFSQEKRNAARQLDKLVNEKELSYSDLPSFNDNTGENLANDPDKLIDYINNKL